MEKIAVQLTSNFANVYPAIVAERLTYHLSAKAFPWTEQGRIQPTNHTWMKMYIESLYSSFKISPPESVNDHALNVKSATKITSCILPKNFKAFSKHLAIILNSIWIHTEKSVKEGLSGALLKGVVDGLLALINTELSMQGKMSEAEKSNLRKILTWFDMQDPNLIWNAERYRTLTFRERDDNLDPGTADISIEEYVARTIDLVNFSKANLRLEIIEELTKWISCGFLGHNDAFHSLKCYHVLVETTQNVPADLKRNSFSRLLDHLSVISQLELESRASISMSPAWNLLSPGKVEMKNDSVDFITAILQIHKVWLDDFKKLENVDNQGQLFWINYGLCNLSGDAFENIVKIAMSNMITMFEFLKKGRIDASYTTPFKQKQNLSPTKILLPHLFGKSIELQENALLILLTTRLVFPLDMFDEVEKTANLYALLYSLTIIYQRIESGTNSKMVF